MKFASQRVPVIDASGSGAGVGFVALGGGTYGCTLGCVDRWVPRSAQLICAEAAAGTSAAARRIAILVLVVMAVSVAARTVRDVGGKGVVQDVVADVLDREPAVHDEVRRAHQHLGEVVEPVAVERLQLLVAEGREVAGLAAEAGATVWNGEAAGRHVEIGAAHASLGVAVLVQR